VKKISEADLGKWVVAVARTGVWEAPTLFIVASLCLPARLRLAGVIAN
jgi:hypothetical protein